MSKDQFFRPGFAIHALPFRSHIWQFAVLVVGQDWWSEDEEDHQAYEQLTWYVQILFWQFSYTKELT